MPCRPSPCCPPPCCPTVIIRTSPPQQQSQCCTFTMPAQKVCCEVPPPPRARQPPKMCCVPIMICEDEQGGGRCGKKPSCCPPRCPGVTCPQPSCPPPSCCPSPCCPSPCCPPTNMCCAIPQGIGKEGCPNKGRVRREKRWPQCNFLKPCIDTRIYRDGEHMTISYAGHIPGEQYIHGRNLPTTTTFAKRRLCTFTPYEYVDPDGCCSFP